MAAFLEQIPSLPATFEHAMIATRRLGARYIWIDCLCILQDDVADWERESREMARVYGRGLCNIAASASKKPDEGLFRDRDDIYPGVFLKSSDAHPDKPLLLVKSDDVSDHEGDKAPLQTRGWVLQERLLSPRILHFSHRQLVWECDELVASESFPRGVPQTWKQLMARRLDITRGYHLWRNRKEDVFLDMWGDVLRRYTAMNLTHRSDLLPALSGVATRLEHLSGAEYLAGIWKMPGKEFSAHLGWRCTDSRLQSRLTGDEASSTGKDRVTGTWKMPQAKFPAALGWELTGPGPQSHPVEYRAPTRSWASTDNCVDLCPLESPMKNEGYDHSSFVNLKAGARILDAQVSAATPGPAGNVSPGLLLVQGPLSELGTGLGGTGPMEIFWDGRCVAQRATKYTLPLYSYPIFDPWEYGDCDYNIFVYLILTPSEEHPNYYIRCGIGRTYQPLYRPPDGELPPPEIWTRVVHAPNAPCEEFLGPKIGHRFRII